MKLKKRYILIIILAAGLLALVFWRLLSSAGGGTPGRKRAKGALAVEVAQVQQRPIADNRTFSGTVFSDNEFVLASKVSGWVKDLKFNIGDKVPNGATVAVLDDEEYRLEVERAKADLEVAEANAEESRNMLDIKQKEFARSKNLYGKKVLSEADLDRVTAEYRTCEAKAKVAAAQVKLKKTSYNAALVKYNYTRIKASWDDDNNARYVGERFVNEGALLTANSPLLSLVDLDSLKVVINVIERDLPRLKLGQPAKIYTEAYRGRAFSGKVFRIAPVVKEKSRQVAVEIVIKNDKHLLKPGMFALVELEFSRNDDATVIPVTALTRRDGGSGVFHVNRVAGTVKFIPVKTGIVTKEYVEIASPKLTGFVVTLGHHLLEDGGAVILPEKQAFK